MATVSFRGPVPRHFSQPKDFDVQAALQKLIEQLISFFCEIAVFLVSLLAESKPRLACCFHELSALDASSEPRQKFVRSVDLWTIYFFQAAIVILAFEFSAAELQLIVFHLIVTWVLTYFAITARREIKNRLADLSCIGAPWMVTVAPEVTCIKSLGDRPSTPPPNPSATSFA